MRVNQPMPRNPTLPLRQPDARSHHFATAQSTHDPAHNFKFSISHKFTCAMICRHFGGLIEKLHSGGETVALQPTLEAKSAESRPNLGHKAGDLMTGPTVGLEVTVQQPDICRIPVRVGEPLAWGPCLSVGEMTTLLDGDFKPSKRKPYVSQK